MFQNRHTIHKNTYDRLFQYNFDRLDNTFDLTGAIWEVVSLVQHLLPGILIKAGLIVMM